MAHAIGNRGEWMEQFKAGTKYGDFRGTSAADVADNESLRSFLTKRGDLHEGDRLVAINFQVGENFHGKVNDPSIQAYVLDVDHSVEWTTAIEMTPLPVRQINVAISVLEFLGLFKRFDVNLTVRGDLIGREFTVTRVDGDE